MFRSEYIGIITAIANDRETGILSDSCMYVLRLNIFGQRMHKVIGGDPRSLSANNIQAQVYAWRHGGPLPDALQKDEPRKTATLIAIDGGKLEDGE